MTMTLEFPTPKIISASWRKIYMERKKKKKNYQNDFLSINFKFLREQLYKIV